MNKRIRKKLIFIGIIQKQNTGYHDEFRVNPFNPLAYIFVIIWIIVIATYGAVNMLRDFENPFKWN